MIEFNFLPRFKEFQFQVVCQVPVWARVFEVDPKEVERQIMVAHAWIDNNPRKAPKNILRFLNNWMSIADRKGSLRKVGRTLPPRAMDPEPDMSIEEMIAIRKKNFGDFRK